MNMSNVMTKRFTLLFLALFLALIPFLLVPDTVEGATPSMPRVAIQSGNGIYSLNDGPVSAVVVTGNLSGATQFAAEGFSNSNRPDDYYNTGWKLYIQHATNITVGTVVDVTDFDGSSGTFTTASAGASYANGDRGLLLFGIMATGLEGAGQLVYSGKITTATSTSVFAVENLIGLPDDLFNQKFYVEYTRDATPTTAPQSEIRRITDFVGTTGTVTCAAFSSTTVLADVVTIMHESVCFNRLPGRLEYSGIASLGTGATGIDPAGSNDSVYVDELKGFGNDYFNECKYWLHVINTTDGAAPLGEYMPVKDYVSATGLFTFGGATATYGLSAVITAADMVSIVHPSIAVSALGNSNSGVQFKVSANTANTTTNFYCDALVGYPDSALVGNYIKVIYDAAGSHSIPEGDKSKITKFNNLSGLITVGTALQAAPAAGDIIRIYPGEADDVLWGTGGVPSVTAAKLAATVSIAEGMLYDSNILDSLTAWVGTTKGIATFPTGVFHANGVSLAENAAWQSDSLRKSIMLTDSIYHYIGSTTGAPTFTGAFPVAGLNMFERVQFLADSTRKMRVLIDSTYHYIGSTTGAPAVTGYFPAAGISMLERQQWQCDSLRKAFSDITTLQLDMTLTLDSLNTAMDTLQTLQNEVGVLQADMTLTLDSLNTAMDSIQTLQNEVGVIDGIVDDITATVSAPYAATNFVTVTVDHAAADSVWSTVATHEVFTVIGAIEFWMVVYDSVALQGGDSLIIEMGTSKIWATLKNDWDAGEIAQTELTAANFIAGAYNVYNPAIANCGVVDGGTGGLMFHGFSNAIDIGYEVQTATTVNAGTTRWLLWYKKLGSTSSVAAGEGGTL